MSEGPASGAAAPAPIGKPAIPDYELLLLVGRGSYGEVWLGRGLTGVYRAIKIVWRDRFGSPEPFEREFRGLAQFTSIPPGEGRHLALLHVGRNESAGFFYYVMELADNLEGGRLVNPQAYAPHTLLEFRKRHSRIPGQECLPLALALAQSLASLHEHGLVHRDIKPSNIIFVGGKPKLADIGLVSSSEGPGTWVGTEGYMAPEGPGTAAADVYSLGKVIYELITGLDRRQYPRIPGDLKPNANSRMFFELNEIVLKACESKPSKRYPDAHAMLEDLLALKAGASVRRQSIAKHISARIAIGLALAALILAMGIRIHTRRSARDPEEFGTSLAASDLGPRSLAVLPFVNLSSDPQNAFFADGIHEEVIVNLAKVHDLKVISRPSVMAYKADERDLRKTAADLGVANIIEGTVQREGTRVRVTVELIRASDEQSIWADSYDRNLTDAFAIEADLAKEIASVLQARLTETERDYIDRRPTASPEAYDLYLRGVALAEDLGVTSPLAQYERVIDLFNQAIAKDPSFGLAYARLTLLHCLLYRFADLDPSPGRLEKARAAAQAAARLAPDLPDTHFAKGVLHDLGEADWNRALAEFRIAEAGLPNDDQLLWWLGEALRRTGQWHEALDCFENSAMLNPRAAGGAFNTVQQMYLLREFARARETSESFLLRFPDEIALNEYHALSRFELDGDRDALAHAILTLPHDARDPEGLRARYRAAKLRGNLAEADRVLADPRVGLLPSTLYMIYDPVSLERAILASIAGEPGRAKPFALEAIAYYRKGSWNPRQMPWAQIGLARAEACAGLADEAVEEAESAWKTVQARDTMESAYMRPLLGEVYLLLDRREKALALLREMMDGPCNRGPQDLRADPLWARLAGDSRFDLILQSAKPL